MLLVAVGIASLIVGCVLGMIFRLLILIPVTVTLTLTLIIIALLGGTWSTAEFMVMAWVGVQIGYLGGAAARTSVVEPGIGAPVRQ
jgi:hypothetical protein